MSFIYQRAKELLATGALDLSTADLRVELVMTNTTVDSEPNVNTLGAFTDRDTYDGANYADADLASVGYVRDDGNSRIEIDADDAVYSNLGAGTRQAQGALLFAFVTDKNSSIPVAYIDQGGFPFAGSGSNVTLQWNSEGIVQIA